MMEFTTERKYEYIKVDDIRYVLKEADENSARLFRNACTKGVTLDDGKVVKVEGIADVQSYLVSMCLFEVLADDTIKNMPTTIATIRSWPSRIVKQMFDWIKEVSDLDEKPTADKLRKDISKMQEQLTEMESQRGSEGDVEVDPNTLAAKN